VIRSFRGVDTAQLFDDHPVRRFQEVERIARRKLLYLDAVSRLNELRVPPGNRLEQLKHDRAGLIVFESMTGGGFVLPGKDGEAYDVEIVDYH
jgi:proteic killer suppression protein